MRSGIMIGMAAGIMIGSVVAAVTLPYFQPEINKIVSRGKQAITNKMDELTRN
ncbi:MAG: hypothetical protein R2876_00130 [Eubacteriales bacterium]